MAEILAASVRIRHNPSGRALAGRVSPNDFVSSYPACTVDDSASHSACFRVPLWLFIRVARERDDGEFGENFPMLAMPRSVLMQSQITAWIERPAPAPPLRCGAMLRQAQVAGSVKPRQSMP
ncbi:MAG: hypothetical protein ABR580_13425, partial [Halomonas sp.]